MSENREKIIATINIIRKLPPSKIKQNISAVTNLLPDLADEILQKIDQPLQIEFDTKDQQDFLKSEFNRDGDSYRSPHSNQYFPPLEGETLMPSAATREFEQKLNYLFYEYRKLYFEGGLCSCYCWDKPDGNFACVVLVKKSVEGIKGVTKANWDSINVVDITTDKASKTIDYKCTSSVVIDLTITNPQVGDVNLSGNLTKSKNKQIAYTVLEDPVHLANVGALVEEMETVLRIALDDIYVKKTQEIIDNLRLEEGSKEMAVTQKKLRDDLFATLQK